MPLLLRLLLLGWTGAGIAWAFWPVVAKRSGTAARVAVLAGLALALEAGRVLGDPLLLRPLLVRSDAVAPPPADAVFVFSGDVDFHRTLFAVPLFRRSQARWFVVSGEGAGGDSGELMARAAEAAGVPHAALVIEREATTTRENVVRTAPLLAELGIRRVIAVTSPWHSRRAAMAAERAWPGVEVISMPVAELEAPFAPRELEACLYYALRLWL